MPQRKTSIRPRVSEQGPSVDPAKSRQILVIDPDPQAGDLIQGIFTTRGATVRTAGGFEQARRQTQRWEPDLVVVSDALQDVQLDQAVSASREQWRHAQTMVLCSKVSGAQAIAMMRLGVCDLLTRPLRKMEVAQRIELALRRQAGRGKVKRRIHRLQRICHKLQHAHDEVTQQVDILCTDLVTAYQELAAQMQQVVQTRDYVALVKQELDLEQLLRKTLEYILEKAGPTNAAIFLPASMDEFSLGGYVNYDWTHESPELLLQMLAEGVAARIAGQEDILHVTDDGEMKRWMGPECDYLQGSHLVAMPCRRKGEALAVIMLFRDGATPFDAAVVNVCKALGPLLAEYLTKIIRIHHRHLPDPPGDDEEQEGDDFGGLAA